MTTTGTTQGSSHHWLWRVLFILTGLLLVGIVPLSWRNATEAFSLGYAHPSAITWGGIMLMSLALGLICVVIGVEPSLLHPPFNRQSRFRLKAFGIVGTVAGLGIFLVVQSVRRCTAALFSPGCFGWTASCIVLIGVTLFILWIRWSLIPLEEAGGRDC